MRKGVYVVINASNPINAINAINSLNSINVINPETGKWQGAIGFLITSNQSTSLPVTPLRPFC